MVLRQTLAIAMGLGLSAPALVEAEGDAGHVLVAQPGLEAMTRYHDVLPWRPLLEPKRLADGQRLHCRKACRVMVDGGSSVALSAGATIAASSPLFFRFEPGALARRSQVLVLLAGEITVTPPERGQTPLVVVLASGLQLALRGTAVRIRASSDGAVVAPAEMGVGLRDRGGWRPLAGARSHRLRASGEIESRPLVVPPRWAVGDDEAMRPIALATDRNTAVVAASWNEVPGAARYLVDIAADEHFATIVKRITVDAPEHGFRAALPEGLFHARVVAVDPDGLDTEPSAECLLRVIRASLPKGGFVADERTLVLPEGEKLRLLAVEDVELSVDKSGFWKAPGELPGPAAARHRLRFRLAGEASTTTTFSLERRALEALVTLSPGAPIWPQDDVKVTVQLLDRSGRIDVRTVAPTFEVKVRGSSLAVSWKQGGEPEVWSALIGARHLEGPSLMEVVARDETGLAIGWGFVELVAGLDRLRP
jgi:hypothetical protein